MTKRFALIAAGLAVAALAACGGEPGQETAASAPRDVLRVAVPEEPGSLEPSKAADFTAANVVANVLETLVELDDDREGVPGLAESWEFTSDGRTVTFHLRDTGRWTNGDPVTAHDFEWSWKRALSPELEAELAYQFLGIEGAVDYNGCDAGADDCEALRDLVGVRALDARTLEVRLDSPQPWFPERVAFHAFAAVHPPTVERYGGAWAEPGHIVTSGPFELAERVHDTTVVLVKNEGWRRAGDVAVERVEIDIVPNGAAARRQFEAESQDAVVLFATASGTEAERLKEHPSIALYPGLGFYYFGFNVEAVPDPAQRRAMALALDRPALVTAFEAMDIPATGMVPPGIPGYEQIGTDFLPQDPDLERARELMVSVKNPVLELTLATNDFPGHERILAEAERAWAKLGIAAKPVVREWAQFLESLGPPPREDVQVYALGWIGDYPDAFTFFEILACGSEYNSTGFCNERFDRLLAEARETQDDAARYALYAEAEELLTGPNGQMPLIPFRWFMTPFLVQDSLRPTFAVGPDGVIDLARIGAG